MVRLIGILVGILTVCTLPVSEILAGSPPSVFDKIEGPQSIYTEQLVELLRQWPPKNIDYSGLEDDPNPVRIRCLETPGEPDYIGLEQTSMIKAPLERVESVLDDVNNYQRLFPGYDEVRLVSKEGGKWLTFWEQHIPVFFVPNVKYEMIYLVDKSLPDRKIYRYKLKESGNLKKSDGLIVIERNRERTRYTELDFFDAEWGIVKTIAPGRIWKDSVEGIYLSDVAIRLKAEHPEWSYDKVSDEGEKILERFPVEKTIEKKIKASEALRGRSVSAIQR